MDHAQHTHLDTHELTSETLKDATIYGADDQVVGRVSHLHGSGAACQVIVDVGGLLGIGAKPVAVGIGQLDFMRGPKGDVHAMTTWSKDELKEMPEHRD